jgi:TatD DNase family protein
MSNVPLSRIVLETDSPYLPPQARRGQRNEPRYVTAVGDKLAEIRAVSSAEIARVTTSNGLALFGMNPAGFSA